jgi:hypothetical protein
MTAFTQYQGIVRRGRIELPSQTELPEGSRVVVIVTGSTPLVDEPVARRRATRWLVETVGNMLAADEGRLVEEGGRPVWRFGAYVTGRGHAPLGPIGHVDIDAHDGELIPNERQAQRLLTNAKTLADSLSRSD